jgi:hypothetical protein
MNRWRNQSHGSPDNSMCSTHSIFKRGAIIKSITAATIKPETPIILRNVSTNAPQQPAQQTLSEGKFLIMKSKNLVSTMTHHFINLTNKTYAKQTHRFNYCVRAAVSSTLTWNNHIIWSARSNTHISKMPTICCVHNLTRTLENCQLKEQKPFQLHSIRWDNCEWWIQRVDNQLMWLNEL